MSGQKCFKCGVSLKPGSLIFIIKITAVSDFDGVIDESENQYEEEEIKLLIQEIQKWPIEELEKDVYQETSFILCKSCKEQFLINPCGTRDKLKASDEYSGMIH